MGFLNILNEFRVVYLCIFPVLEIFLQIQMFMLMAALWNLWSCIWRIHFLVWYGKCLEFGGRERVWKFPSGRFSNTKLTSCWNYAGTVSIPKNVGSSRESSRQYIVCLNYVSDRLDELSEQLILLTSFFAFFKFYVNITEATVSPVCQARTTCFSKAFHPLLFFI